MTAPTPGTVWIRCTARRSTISVSSSRLYRSEKNEIVMIGEESASALVTWGSLMSCGSRPRTRLTRSRTSLAASSMFLAWLNSIVMLVLCSAEEDRRVRMPSMEESSFSSGSVTLDSMTSAEAPA